MPKAFESSLTIGIFIFLTMLCSGLSLDEWSSDPCCFLITFPLNPLSFPKILRLFCWPPQLLRSPCKYETVWLAQGKRSQSPIHALTILIDQVHNRVIRHSFGFPCCDTELAVFPTMHRAHQGKDWAAFKWLLDISLRLTEFRFHDLAGEQNQQQTFTLSWIRTD